MIVSKTRRSYTSIDISISVGTIIQGTGNNKELLAGQAAALRRLATELIVNWTMSIQVMSIIVITVLT